MKDEEEMTVNSLAILTTKGIKVETIDGKDLTGDLKKVMGND